MSQAHPGGEIYKKKKMILGSSHVWTTSKVFPGPFPEMVDAKGASAATPETDQPHGFSLPSTGRLAASLGPAENHRVIHGCHGCADGDFPS